MRMTRILDLSRYSLLPSLRLLGFTAAALLTLSIAAGERAEALSLINSGGATASKTAADGLTIEVHGGGGHGGGGHGGGGHGGGVGGHGGFGGHGGGMGIHGGAFRTGPAFVGGARFGGLHGGHRFAHRHFRRVFVGGVWYDYQYYDDYPYYSDYPAYYAVPGCSIVMTDYGPRRVCNYRPWRHHHHRRHHCRRHHRVYR
jgi:hypothetical protein